MPMRASSPADTGATPSHAMASAPPSVAPDALPSRYGSASGLRNSPCATAPASPSKAPAIHAPMVRGKRISVTICRAMGSSRSRIRLSNPVLPTAAPTAISSRLASSSANISQTARWRLDATAWCSDMEMATLELMALCPPGIGP
ncbi:hypothetical protein SDC9_159984 [bioreactor metagenome]|uniref:Uncharacterized protein n=1 Tax=bioreactor metagenome TaxID=1076179 RepID=A0A645FE39_9ZZZZ